MEYLHFSQEIRSQQQFVHLLIKGKALRPRVCTFFYIGNSMEKRIDYRSRLNPLEILKDFEMNMYYL